MFDILHDAHLAIGHRGKHRMESECKKKYKNITRDVIKLYLRLCEGCQKKLKSAKKGLVVKPMVFSEMNSRCQVDLIDMQSHPDREYKFIMVYQDHLTKFVQIRPLTSKRAKEVAKSLVDIFCIFGAPSILQSDNGREFANHVIEELCTMWSGLKIVHGKPRYSQSQGSVERANQDIQNMLMTWMDDENCTRWSEGLRFVQLMKNRAYHDGIKQAPYAAMFGHDIKVGLSTSAFPKEAIENLRTEEELEKVVREFGLGEQPQQEININQSMDSDPEPDNLQEDITQGGNMENRNNNYRENASNTETSENQSKCVECDNLNTSGNIRCELCLYQRNIQSNRLDAKRNLENQAKKMKALSNSKFPPCSVGDTVRVTIPDVDRGRGDFRNILMTVIEKTICIS
ncbi:KRAB-A domain-containing protein 2-like [Anthonomus grandis grandis]|uniref:KRAB-A domain-containing protein 2-like n=1 Tax=Anthonomus grandis grandis TaxID=2921223 RepID=UPI0021657CA3|nr:KRAB-A domain-containing protein 2-like [Anthonomus grandis grandis]